MRLVGGVIAVAVATAAMAWLRAQVVTPVEVSDPKELQRRHLTILMAAGRVIETRPS